MTPMILQNLSLQRGHRRLLDHLSLSLNQGELMILLGPNGCGKSTLLKAISGELAATGEIQLFGRPRDAWPARELARRLAVLPQHSDLRFNFQAQEVVQLGRLPWPERHDEHPRQVERRMQEMDVWSLRRAPYLQLSGGEKQRVHLARVLCQLDDRQPGLLLLDEPTSALDPGHQHQVLQALRQVSAQGHTILMVLHDLNLASRYADRLVLMQQGRLLATGTARDTLTAPAMQALYGAGPELWHHPDSGRPVIC